MGFLHRLKPKAAPQVDPPPTSEVASAQGLYTQLASLVALRAFCKQRQLNHQQKLVASNLGNHHATRKGRGMTFSEVRQYQAGDDIRHIDWRVTARTQKAHTKVFVEEHERPTYLVTEQTPALFFGSKQRLKTAQAANIAAILAWCSLNQNERIGGLAFNGATTRWVAPKRSQKTALHYLQTVISQQQILEQPGSGQPQVWSELLQRLANQVKPGGKVFLIGDMFSLAQANLGYLQRMHRHVDMVAIHVVDPLEKQLPELGWLSLTRTFGEELLQLDSFRRQTRQAYQQAYQHAWQQAQDALHQYKIPLVEVQTDQDPIKQLLQARIIL